MPSASATGARTEATIALLQRERTKNREVRRKSEKSRTAAKSNRVKAAAAPTEIREPKSDTRSHSTRAESSATAAPKGIALLSLSLCLCLSGSLIHTLTYSHTLPSSLSPSLPLSLSLLLSLYGMSSNRNNLQWPVSIIVKPIFRTALKCNLPRLLFAPTTLHAQGAAWVYSCKFWLIGVLQANGKFATKWCRAHIG